jgi:RNA 2',3'-cyclic 3'-phosphodiesterase
MKNTFRGFIAIPLEADVSAWLAGAQNRLRASLLGTDVRWVDPANIHITLKFLGETPESTVPDIRKAMDRAAEAKSSFSLIAGGLGCFPSINRPRVVWAGIGASRELERLQSDLETYLETLPFPREDRSFAPHLTLGRVREGVTMERGRRIGEAVTRQSSAAGEISIGVQEIFLFQSERSPGGASYSVRYRCPLTLP